MKKITRLLLAASLLIIGVNSVIAEEIKGLERGCPEFCVNGG